MNNKIAEMVREAFERELGAKFSLLEIKAMTRVEPSDIDDDVYTLVGDGGILFVARLLKTPNGTQNGVWVYEKSLAMTMRIKTR